MSAGVPGDANRLNQDERHRIEQALPGYDLDGEIGRGGVGVVFGATHSRLGRRVAVKRLPDLFARDPIVRRRFVNEAKLLATLDHPHIVPIFDFIEDEGLCLLVMELLSGGSLYDRHRVAALNRAEACAVILATCSALNFAHRRNILHRDIKPANLMFSAEGVVKVVDFGIAKMLGGDESLATAAGTVLGSPAFMAPEQVTGDPSTPATDVYSLATVLFDLLAGRLPYQASEGPLQMLLVRVRADPVPLNDVAAVPPALSDVVMRGLSRDPRDRYQTAEAFGVAVADAATKTLGRGWLTESMASVYATGDLLRSLDGAQADDPSPESSVLLPPPSDETPTSILDSVELARLRPLKEVLEPQPDGEDEHFGVGPQNRATKPVSSKELRVVGEGKPRPMTPAKALSGESSPGERFFVIDVSEPGRQRRQLKVKRSAVFGRKCEGVVLADPEVSRQHFKMDITDAGVLLEDLASTNGTYLNGTLIESATRLRPDDVVEAGDTSLVVMEGPALEPVAPPPSHSETMDAPARTRTITVEPDAAGAPKAEDVEAGLEEAQQWLAAHGLADEVELVMQTLAVHVVSGPVVRRSQLIVSGTVVDAASNTMWLIHSDESPADRPVLGLTLLTVMTKPAYAECPAIAIGFALRAADIADPSGSLGSVELPALSEANDGLRAAMGRSLVGYLEHFVGIDALGLLIASAAADGFEAGLATLMGRSFEEVETSWRAWLTSIARPAAPLPGPLCARWWPMDAMEGDSPLAVVKLLHTAAPLLGLERDQGDRLASLVRRVPMADGTVAGEGPWLGVVLNGEAEVILTSGPCAGTVVSTMSVATIFGTAFALGAPRAVALRAVRGLELGILDAPTREGPGPTARPLPDTSVAAGALTVAGG